MNESNLKNLIEELKAEGASDKEAEELSLLSKNFSNLLKIERSESLKTKFLRNEKPLKTSNKYFAKKYAFAFLVSILLLLGFSSAVSAQKSLPGDPLYPIKRLSENIISAVNPSFKSEILKRRSEEIKNLSGKKNSTEFHQAVDDYEKVLNEDKKINPEKISESRKNLEEAQKTSLEENKKDIEKVIIQTRDKQELLQKQDVKGDILTPAPSETNNDGEQNKNLDKDSEKPTNLLEH